jgi:cytochrome c
MKDRQNTINGWILFAGIVALGGSIVSGEVFKAERPEKMGYPIEGVVAEGESAEAAKPAPKPAETKPAQKSENQKPPAAAGGSFAEMVAKANPKKGEQVFKKCTACHNADNGGANALGPNLWGVLGEPIGKGAPGVAFSEALAGHGGTWDWNTLSDWLANPKKFAPGTKMTFAGLSNPEDRANVIAFLNTHSASPLPLPAAPAEAAPAAGDKAAAEAEGAGAEKAPNTPVLNEATAAKGGQKSTGGEAAAVSQ